MSTILRIGREAVLWCGATLGAACLLFLVAGLFGITPLVFSSGSMSPTYDVGALGIARHVDAADLRVGDVVSVLNAGGVRVTHRVVDVQPQADRAVLTLQGDANSVADAQPYTVSSADRVSFGVPLAGYALNLAASPLGLAVVGLIVCVSVWLGFGQRGDLATARPADVKTRSLLPIGAVGVVAAGAALGATGHAPWLATSALWTDFATITATASAAAAPPAAPTITSCTPVNGAQPYSLTWTWPGPGTADSFKLYYGGGGSARPATTLPDVTPPYAGQSVAINDEAGTFQIVAVVGGVESALSNTYNYAGKNNGKTCIP